MKMLRSLLSPVHAIPALLAFLSFAPIAGAFPIITNVVETGGDNEATDTIVAQWTGRAFTNGIANEPRPNRPAGLGFTGEVFAATAPCFVDRNHCYTNAAGNVPIPPYLVGAEYIMSGNDNRDNVPYTLDVSVNASVRVYMLIDNRLSDGDGNTPPTFDATHMQWILNEGWVAVKTGINRTSDATLPDEVGVDEFADGTINSFYSVYTKTYPAGTFRLQQADNAGRNMYGAVVVPLFPRDLPNVVQIGGNKIGSVAFNNSTNAAYSVVAGGNDIWDRLDEFTYAYTEVTGDFDVQVRVESVQPNARWSKFGLMARESLSEFSRMAFQRSTPPDVPTSSGGNGVNDVRLAYRTGLDNNSGENGGAHEDNDLGAVGTSYPNMWLRLIRTGSVIKGQSSINGTTWTDTSMQNTTTWGGGALPSSLFLGLASSRHSGGPTAAVEYRDFKFNYTAPFAVAGASSRGNPKGARVNFTRPPAGSAYFAANYTMTATGGPRLTVVTGLRFTSANDSPARDPGTFTLEGTTGDPSGGPWTLIASGNTGFGTSPTDPLIARLTTVPDVTFANTASYSSYRLLFPTLRDAPSANSMQIAEVAFLDAGGNDVTAPGDPVIPTSSNSPGAEGSVNVIDNNINTKYLNFDKLNTGFTVTPSGGATATGATVLSVAPGPNLNTVQLTTSTLVEGATYTVTVANVQDTGGAPLGTAAASFVHGAGYEARRILVTHNKFSDSGYYRNSDAIAKGIGDLVVTGDRPTGFPGVQTNSVFEDPIPDTGGNERFGSRISGLLNITVNGNYTFYMSSDDVGFCYLSTDENPANKVQICNEPAWNGPRQYISGGNQSSRGTPPANISAPQALLAGRKYYLEVLFNEGGGGNNGSATWLPPGGPAVANGSSPIPEANFAPARQLNGTVFGALGPIRVTTQPSNITVTALTPASFGLKLDGTPPYQIQWLSNGVPIPGANGQTYVLPVTPLTADNAVFSAVVANEFSTDSSAAAILRVLNPAPPHLTTANGSANLRGATINFDNRLDPVTATNATNYSILGLTISSVALLPSGRGVVLGTSLQTEGTTYTVTVRNVRDLTLTQVMDPNPSSVTFTSFLFCTGFGLLEAYRPESGVNINTLLDDPNYPNNPNERLVMTRFDSRTVYPDDSRDNYGARMTAYFLPPASGDYIFYIRSDDSSRLYLNPTGADPAGKVQIQEETGCCGAFAGHATAPQTLTVGTRYYLEMDYKEGGGGDYGQVAVKLASDPADPNSLSPIPGGLIGQYFDPALAPALTITQQPANASVVQNVIVTFSVGVTSSPAGPLSYQWRRNGTPIPLANLPTLRVGPVALADTGSRFDVIVCVPGRVITSSNALLTVTQDTNPPVVLSAAGSASFTNVTVVFNELVDQASAQDTFSYSISGNLNVIGAVLNPDRTSVTLTTDPQAENTLYTVTVSAVTDLAGNAIVTAGPGRTNSATFRSFVAGCGGLTFERYDGIGGTPVANLTSSPNFPNNPSLVSLLTVFDTGGDQADNYGARVRGVFIPPTSGNWIFYLRSDDASQLFLNPTGPSAAGKVLIQQETGCCGAFSGHASAAQALVANQGYYIEALYKEGGGGDYVQVAARLQTDGVPGNNARPSPDSIQSSLLGFPGAPPGVGGPVVISQAPTNRSVLENQPTTFSVIATNPNSLPLCYQWRRNGVEIPGATGSSYTLGAATLADSNAMFSVVVSVIGSKLTTPAATLSVSVDRIPPRVLGAVGTRTMDAFILTYDEPVDPATSQDTFNYVITSTRGPLAVNSLSLSADGRVLTMMTAAQAEDLDYIITINNVADRARVPNIIAANTRVTVHSFAFSCGFLLFEAYNTPVGGTAVALLTSSPNYPNNPRETFYIPTFNTRNAYPDDSHEQYGGRITGQFIARTTGNHIFYLRSDDASELWFNPNGQDTNGAVKIQEDTGCCGAFAAHASPPQPLVAGRRYYIQALYKEGGGGDYCQVAVKLDADPTDPNTLSPISSGNLGVFADPSAATINVTQHPVAQQICQVSAGPPNLLNESFITGNGGFTVSTPQPFDGPWVYDGARGTWREDGQGPDNGHPNTSKLNSPALTITQPGPVTLTFSHRWSFEFTNGVAWDGGNVQISTNGGPYVLLAGSNFTQNGYNGAVQSVNLYTGVSDLRGQPAFVSRSANYGPGTFVTTIANLGNFNPGDTISIQFVAGSDSNTKYDSPGWEIDSFALGQAYVGGNTVTFMVAGTASIPNVPNQPIFYQWQRNDGVGYFDIPGANSASYTIAPRYTDNGVSFRASFYVPGKTTNSQAALLTVNHRNTPPEFNCGPSFGQPADCGPRSMVWATGIAPDSIRPTTGSFATDFSGGVPAGTAVYGNAYVAGGFLHVTDATNGLSGSLIINDLLGGAPLGSFSMTFRALVGGGTTPPADGFAVTVGNNIVNGPFGEDGSGTGLTVSFDSYNNDAVDDAPAIDVLWAGTRIAHTHIGGSGLETGGQFVPVSIVLSQDGRLNVTAAGQPVYVGLVTGYVPISGARFGFGGRTGGLNEKHYIDDINIQAVGIDDSLAEASQTLQFIVTNDNPALFTQQPAISPIGTLTYTPSIHAAGVAMVTVIARDNGGSACGGTDTSLPCVFSITLNCTLVARNDGGSTRQDQPIIIPAGKLLRNDGTPEGNLVTPFGTMALLQVSATSTNGGNVALVPGGVSYTPRAGFSGVDRFTYTVTDGSGFGSAQVEILVANGALPSLNQVALIANANGVLIRFAGVPGRTYQVQRATSVTGPWSTVFTGVAPLHGIIEYQDTTPPQPTAFYRTLAP